MFITQVEITNRCQLQCPYCPRTLYHPELRSMSCLEMERVFTEILTWPFAAKERVAICGHGEPLLNLGFEDFLFHPILGKIPDLWIITNGMLLTPQWIRTIMESGVVNFIQVSLQTATREVFGKLQVGGNFDTVIRNTRRLIKSVGGTRTKIRIQYLRTGLNPNEKIRDFEKLLGVKFHDNIRFHIHPVGRTIRINFPGAMKTGSVCWNQFGRNLIINAYGDLVGCCWDNTRFQSYGNIFEKSLNELRSGVLFRELREELVERDFQRLPLCEMCLKTS